VLEAGPSVKAVGASALDLVVGCTNPTSPGSFFGGLIDDVRVYSSALSADDIISLMATASPIIKPKSLFTF
jgi:hypothetical protein